MTLFPGPQNAQMTLFWLNTKAQKLTLFRNNTIGGSIVVCRKVGWLFGTILCSRPAHSAQEWLTGAASEIVRKLFSSAFSDNVLKNPYGVKSDNVLKIRMK